MYELSIYIIHVALWEAEYGRNHQFNTALYIFDDILAVGRGADVVIVSPCAS